MRDLKGRLALANYPCADICLGIVVVGKDQDRYFLLKVGEEHRYLSAEDINALAKAINAIDSILNNPSWLFPDYS